MGRPNPRLSRPELAIPVGDGRAAILGRAIGTGTVASVYRATLMLPFGVERLIAVKVFDVLSTDDRASVVSTMGAAARAAARLRHPNVAEVLELGMLGGTRPFLFQELIEGAPLASLVASYTKIGVRMPLDLALFLACETATGVAAAHAARGVDGEVAPVLHGDLSAREVLLSVEGEVKVTDFGIAAATRAASGVRSLSGVAQRAATAAPEVLGGSENSPQADVFSLGVLLWEMLVGPRFPPDIDDTQRLIMARSGRVHSTVFDPQLPSALKTVLRRALERDAQNRYQDAADLAYDLRRVAFGMGVGDGRVFLRHALKRMCSEVLRPPPVESAAGDADDVVTVDTLPGPLPAVVPESTPPTSAVVRRLGPAS